MDNFNITFIKQKFLIIFHIIFFLNIYPSNLLADYKLGVYLEEFCFENGYGFAFKKERPSKACKPYGLAVNKFANNSFGKEIGLKELDIIVSFDGKVTKTWDDFMSQFSSTINNVDHQMTIHRWNRSVGKMESYNYKFKVEKNEKKTVSNSAENFSSNKKSNQEESKKSQINLNKNDECIILDKPDISDDYLVEKSVTQKNQINYFYFWVNNQRVLINKSDKSLKFSNGNLFVPNHSETFPYTCKHEGQKKQLEILVNGYGVIKFDNGDTYNGTINQKLSPEGEGEISYSNGSLYKGQIINSQPNGIGRLTDNFTIYEGSFKNGIQDGPGKLIIKAFPVNNLSETKVAELKTKINELEVLRSEQELKIEQLEQSTQEEIKLLQSNLNQCKIMNKKIAEDIDFDTSIWDQNECDIFKLKKCERLCSFKTNCTDCIESSGEIPNNLLSKSAINNYQEYDLEIQNLQNLLKIHDNKFEISDFSFNANWKNGEIDPLSFPLKIEFDNGLYYIGILNSEYLPHGEGSIYFNDSTYLSGEWVNARIKPESKLFINDYEAAVEVNMLSYNRDDLINQIKVKEINFKNKNKYIGDYNISLGINSGLIMEGSGTILSIDGRVLQKGKFKSNILIEGYDNGQFIYKNGNIYKGEIDNYLPNGFGKIFDSQNKLISNGNFINGKKSGLFVENKTNQLQLVNYISDGSIQNMGNTEFEICDPKINNKDNCNTISSTQFINDLEGQFIGSFKDNQPYKGYIYFNSTEFKYFEGAIYQEEFNGSLYKANGEVYEGTWKLMEDLNRVFIGSLFDEFKNETVFSLNEDFSIDEKHITNYAITNDRKIILKHDLIVPTSQICNQKFFEPNAYNKAFNISDFHDLSELKKKKDYYNNLLTELQKYSKDNVFDWDAILNINPNIKMCYFNSYEQMQSANITAKIDANTKYEIKLIARNYILLENNYLIKRFDDQLSFLEDKFFDIPKKYRDSNGKILEAYAPILLDFAYSIYPNEIINYKNDLNLRTDISKQMFIMDQNISKLDEDNSIDKATKKTQIKSLKEEIKLLKKQLKELNKKIDKEYTWNNFEDLTSKLSLQTKDIYEFAKLSLYPNGQDNIFVQIKKWEDQLRGYNNRQQAILEEKQRKLEEKRKKEKAKADSNNLSPRDRALLVIQNAKSCFINSNNKLFLKPDYDFMMEFLYEFSNLVGTYLDHAADSYLYNARSIAERILDYENCN